MLSLIAGMSENNVIGDQNKLPWYLPNDLRRFSRITRGHPVIMGRNTYESIIARNGKLLPDRKNIMITRHDLEPIEGVTVTHSPEEAIEVAKKENAEEIFVIGGHRLYVDTLPKADRLYLTIIHQKFDGDTFFPEFDWSDWQIKEKEFIPKDEKNEYDSTFYILDRK